MTPEAHHKLSRLPLLIILGVWLMSVIDVRGEAGGDPSAIWYQGFLTFEATVELEKQGKYLEALNKCNETKALYDGLAYQYPSFQPEIVNFKRKVIADTRLRIIQANKSKNSSPRGASARQGNRPPNSRKLPAQNPEFPDAARASGNGASQLPQWNNPRSVGRAANDILQNSRVEVEQLESRIRQLNNDNQRLSKERDAMRHKRDQLVHERDQLQRQVNTDPSNAAQLRQLLDEAMSELSDANKLVDSLFQQLASKDKQIENQNAQISELKAERDQLQGIVQGRGLGSEALRDLMVKNQQLSKRLELVEKVAKQASADSKQKERDIQVLRTEIAKVKAERERLIGENFKHQQEMQKLHQKLDMLSKGLSKVDRKKLAKLAPEQQAENDLLRTMVYKQLRRQAQHKQAKELLLRQLERVGAKSNSLLAIVDDMAQGPQLTKQEKSLFRSPQITELIDEIETPAPATDSVAKEMVVVDPIVEAEILTSPVANEKINRVVDSLSAPASSPSRSIPSFEVSELDREASLNFKVGKYGDAEASWLKILHHQPQNINCLCNLGNLKMVTEKHSEAENYLQKAIAMDRRSGRAYYLLGRNYLYQNKLDRALASLEQGIQIEPDNPNAHNCLGVIAGQKGWIKRAEKAFIRAVTINPKFGDAHFNLAVLFSSHASADPWKAGQHYVKAVDLGVPRDATIEKFLENSKLGQLAPGRQVTAPQVVRR